MVLIIECECGNRMEVEPETIGNVAYFNRELKNNDFYISDEEHSIELLEDTVDDESDVEAKISELRIDCHRCGRYIVLECD